MKFPARKFGLFGNSNEFLVRTLMNTAKKNCQNSNDFSKKNREHEFFILKFYPLRIVFFFKISMSVH